MNREIKYMAWDKHYKKLEKVTMLLLDTNELDHEGNLNEPANIDHFELMQYTNLKDKNGTEFYEGFLLKVPHNNYIAEGIHEVHFYDDGFYTSSVLFSNKQTANKNTLSFMISIGATVCGHIFQTN